MSNQKHENRPVTRTLEIVGLAFILYLLVASTALIAAESNNEQASNLNLTIDDIVCRNNENTQCSFISKKYYQKVGELVKPDEIADAKLRLGTLRQFRNVRIVLEKGSKRGHVVVVIIVEEADQIQYNLATNYYGQNDDNIRANNFDLSFGVTDFNFLGSGKQLDFRASSNFANAVYQQIVRDNFGVSSISTRDDSDSDSYSATISYLDPHLFDSETYYFNAQVSHNTSQSSGTTTVVYPDSLSVDEYQRDFDSSIFSLGFGKRFARNSYLILKAYTSRSESDQSPTRSDSNVGFGYGWDSRDDFVFPTKGSSFSTFVFGLNKSDYKTFSVSYQDHLSLSDDVVFSYGLSNSFSYQKGQGTNGVFNPFSTISFSDIDSSDGKNGNYSGWKYSLRLPLKDTSIEDIGFGASYIIQTDKLLVSFSLNYQSGWGG